MVQKRRAELTTITLTLTCSDSAAIFHTSPVASFLHSAIRIFIGDTNPTAEPWLKAVIAHFVSLTKLL